MQSLLTRRSTRSFKKELPAAELIDRVIEAGLYAPNGRGLQSAIIVAVTDPQVRGRLSEMNREIAGLPEGEDPFYGAPVILVVLAKKDVPTHVYDGSVVMENLMLAAHDLGLASCWIHRAKQEFESEEGKQILRDAGIEGDYEGIGHCAIGHAQGELPEAKPREPGRVFYIR